MATPTYFPDAVATKIGWAHPLTGEQLDSTKGLAGAINYYKPNAGAKSFLDPAGSTVSILQHIVQNQKASFAVLSKKKVKSVSWDYGNNGSPVVDDGVSSYSYPKSTQNKNYTVKATVTFSDNSTATLTDTVTIKAVPVSAT